jgi:glyoxylase-like metal-dependent hydrolase (beta-lactamase superfamily II)
MCLRIRRGISLIIFRARAVIFVGDTLFAMGCGRLFEGTAAQMYDNMQRIRGAG